ncbi:thioredoxin domain-containing protein [Pseudenhygromyxa sp. WMMC2535]|uniref:DsbA family protein n=1 Tax=Pseudenhygromyxa sp. WMMC2535 TaxID=2712867 RepID=UPI00155784BA|nr:thioredoxin domain-containing protein [Pseudenhygromyxa sp. WMMC2535]NVB37993.1 thioredoxin domain-containing protein [Pseudenhygromyxa sp. WMMC2535]
MPTLRASLTLALTTLLLAPACKRGADEDHSQAPEPAAAPAEGTGADAESDRSIAVVGDGELEPDPEQIAAGVPYLRFRVDIGGSPSRGPADAPVTIVMFSDFECPYCEEALATITALQADYPDEIRLVYKAFPLNRHPTAMLAALIGYSAHAQGKFWPWHDRVFSGGGIDEPTLERYIDEVGLDRQRLAKELDELDYAAEVRRDLRTAKRLELRSTPVFFVNGRRLDGARPRRVFEHVIEQELSLAKGLAEKGVSAAELYEFTTQWGYTAIVYEDARPSLDEDSVYPVPIGDAPTRGRDDAPITIVAFSDFQCPFCARGHERMEALRQEHGDDIRFVFRHFPLPGHPLGALASRASFAARDAGKFWEFHDAVYAFGARYTADDLLAIGDELGIPRAALEEAMVGTEHDAAIEADMDLGIRLGITGTPAYFINGRPVVGVQPLLDFRMLVAEELRRVEAARNEGVAADQIYRHLTGTD